MKKASLGTKKQRFYLLIFLFLIAVSAFFVFNKEKPKENIVHKDNLNTSRDIITGENKDEESQHPMSIELIRQNEYPGKNLLIEEKLSNGINYEKYIASYESEGLRIYGLLTIPLTEKPENGFPGIIFIHGYIPPEQYSTVDSYPTYQAILAQNGFVTFKPDLRGHGNSEGEPISAHYSEKYVTDTLNAKAYLEKHPDVNSERIGYWGHSNGGEIGLRVAVIDPDIKAFVFWAGVVGSYQDMLETYNEKIPFLKNENNPLIEQYDLPSQNPDFWKEIDPYYYLDDISAPIQIHHGTRDQSVPVELSLSLKASLEKANKEVSYFEYPNADHNLSQVSSLAWQRSIQFFQENLQ